MILPAPAPGQTRASGQESDTSEIRTALEDSGHLRDLTPLPGPEGNVVYYWLDFTPRGFEKITGAVTLDELTQVASGDYSVLEAP